ncbi:MAG: murein transglycosylase A [Alphaproteobacteria bacterium]
MTRFFLLSMLLVLSACATKSPPEEKPQRVLKAVEFNALPSWSDSSLYIRAAEAFGKSCVRIAKADPAKNFSEIPEAKTYGDWQRICAALAGVPKEDATALREFFESNFRPYAVSAGHEAEGLFTGYYEAALRGSLTSDAVNNIPLYTRPDDLVMVDLGQFRDELKGQRIAGRVIEGNLKPYEDRAKIVAGQWPHNDKVLVWVDDAVDAFFVQIQGSGVVQLKEGGVMRIGYAGQNGHIYTAIGKELIARGELTKENVSMQAIRDWLSAHPQQADEIMNTNRSYVFFKHLEKDGPDGGEGVTLTPVHSLAVDHSLFPYGAPVWVDIDYPVNGQSRLRNLMVMQDTGGAIRGPVRGDVFWGYGERAEVMAGPMKAKGRYWILLPR